MKTRNKALVLSLSAVLLVGASVFGTMAYLTDKEEVTNIFTVGKVGLTLDEADVKTDGTYESDVTERVQANEYHLMPGHTYIKDPVVHVDENSEDAWIFVKVENGIAAYEDSASTIADQITTNDWNALEGQNGVYYQSYTKNQEDKDLEVFGSFKIAGNAESLEGWTSISTTSPTIIVTAYAIQKDGFETAAAAWEAAPADWSDSQEETEETETTGE